MAISLPRRLRKCLYGVTRGYATTSIETKGSADAPAGLAASAVTVRAARAAAALAALAVLVRIVVGPPIASAESTHGTGMAYTDRTLQPFTFSNGLSSKYHVYAAGIPQDHAVGLVLQFDGDRAYEFANPTSAYSLGGPSGIVEQARSRGIHYCPGTHPGLHRRNYVVGNRSTNANFVANLLDTGYNIDTKDIWLVGYSGGSQFITQFFLPKYSHKIAAAAP